MNYSVSTPQTTHNRTSIVLTARGKVVLGVSLTLAVLFAWVLLGSGRADAVVEPSGPTTSVVVVQAGENLWSIAQSVNPDGDPRDLVMRIRAINGLGAQHVFPGQSLIVPVS
jgi:nucleoid-associated protein YgaU